MRLAKILANQCPVDVGLVALDDGIRARVELRPFRGGHAMMLAEVRSIGVVLSSGDQQLVAVYELAAIRLRDRLEQQPLLFGRHAKCLTGCVAEYRDLLAFGEGLTLQNNCPVRHGARSDLHRRRFYREEQGLRRRHDVIASAGRGTARQRKRALVTADAERHPSRLEPHRLWEDEAFMGFWSLEAHEVRARSSCRGNCNWLHERPPRSQGR